MSDEDYTYRVVHEKEETEYYAFENDSLLPGRELKVDRSVYGDSYDISDLVQKTPDELQALFADSTNSEQTVFQIVIAAVNQWEKRAAITQHYLRALAYVKTPEPENTDNKWTTDKNGTRTISNKVYKMTCQLEETTRWNLWKGKGLAPRWCVRWALYTNSPVYGRNIRIAGQDRQFEDKSEAEKYLNGRIAAHAKLFTEVSPTIPKDHASCFYVSSTLLPGYQVEGEERQAERPSVIGQLSETKKQMAETTEPPKSTKKQPER